MNKKNFLRNKNSMSKKRNYKNNNKIYILIILVLILIILVVLIYFNYLINIRLDLLSTNLEILAQQQIEFNEKLLEHVANISKNNQISSTQPTSTVKIIKNIFIELIISFLEIIFI